MYRVVAYANIKTLSPYLTFFMWVYPPATHGSSAYPLKLHSLSRKDIYQRSHILERRHIYFYNLKHNTCRMAEPSRPIPFCRFFVKSGLVLMYFDGLGSLFLLEKLGRRSFNQFRNNDICVCITRKTNVKNETEIN